MREQIGKEHLRIMHKNRGEVLEKTKIELLEVYAMQMAGRVTLDNKQINELVTTTSSEDDVSDLSNLEEEDEESNQIFDSNGSEQYKFSNRQQTESEQSKGKQNQHYKQYSGGEPRRKSVG